MFTAIVSDYTKHRYIFTLLPTLLGMTGFIILLCVHHNNHLQYAALFLAASGVYSAMPIIVCWFNTNCKLLNQAQLGIRVFSNNLSYLQWLVISEELSQQDGK